jgi:hypothetical protein
MTPDVLTCPYCNALVPRPAQGGRVTCPRCEEVLPGTDNGLPFSVRPAPLNAAPPPETAGPPEWLIQLAGISVLLVLVSLTLKLALPENNTAQRAFPFMVLLAGMGLVASLWLWFFQRTRSNHAIAGFVLSNMIVVAMMVLPFALATTKFRRGNDPQKPEIEPPGPGMSGALTPVAPSQLAGLAFVPDDCQILAGIHVAELTEAPGGAKLLAGSEAEPRPWLIALGMGFVENATGLQTADLDHLVIGVHMEGIQPRVSMVARTRRPYDVGKVARSNLLSHVVRVSHHGKDLFQFSVKLGEQLNLPVEVKGEGSLWCADAKTLVLLFRFESMLPRDKDLLRPTPQGPTGALRQLLEEKLTKGTQLWWAADLQELKFRPALLPIGKKDPELDKLMQGARRITGGLCLASDAAVLTTVECADAARRVAELLEKQSFKDLKPKVVGPPPDSRERWVTLQLRGDSEAVTAVLRQIRLLAMPRKG